MHASAIFKVTEFTPSDYVSPVTTGTAVGHAHMVKDFAGDLEGRSTTQFSAAFDPATGVGTYVALEAFEGRLGDRSGELVGVTGTGHMVIDEDGTHHVELVYHLPE